MIVCDRTSAVLRASTLRLELLWEWKVYPPLRGEHSWGHVLNCRLRRRRGAISSTDSRAVSCAISALLRALSLALFQRLLAVDSSVVSVGVLVAFRTPPRRCFERSAYIASGAFRALFQALFRALSVFFRFNSCIYNPLHAARRAMAAAGFLDSIPFSYLEPACAVIVRCPLSPSPQTSSQK